MYMKDETLSRLSESVNAKYLSRDIAKTYMRTMFIRTHADIKKPQYDLLILMYIFGMKNVYLEYRDTILLEILQ